ncbi:MAG: hypothetical protein JWN50_124 [Parcubacteria group bacterium]|nr:hypothetical protein [Parcubacteria group bacterium]
MTDNPNLEEALQVSHEKGVPEALGKIEKSEDWMLEDDVHDALASEVRQGVKEKGAESGPLYRALNMTLLEVGIPETQEVEGQSFKTLISSMEQFYAGMIGVSEQSTMGKNYFVLEIANGEGSEEFVFYASVPNEKKDLFEKHLLSIFPTARVVERERDYNLFASGSSVAASVAELASPSAMPLKTYDAFDSDPLSQILSAFSKIPKDGAGAVIQIIFNPQGELYTKRYTEAVRALEKGKSAKEAIAERSLGQEVLHELSGFFSTKKKEAEDKPKAVDSASIELVKKKLESPTVSTNIRIVTSAPNVAEAEKVLGEIESAFNQFSLPVSNALRFVRVKSGKGAFFRNFSFRIYSGKEELPLNLKELTSLFHFHTSALAGASQLKQVRSSGAPTPLGLPAEGTFLGTNSYQGRETKVYISPEDRLRHLYVIGQTGTGKSSLLKNMIVEDMRSGHGLCFIDPHGSDVEDILALVPPERQKDVIYFDPAYVERPMALNMLEYDRRFPEQKTFVVNEMLSIFNKLFDMKTSGGPMFEQYFRNAVLLTIDDPDTGSTLVDVSRVLTSKEFRMRKLEKCTNPLVIQFWREVADKAGGEASLANMVPYIVSKFDNFLANDIMRPVIGQEHSTFNFREIMDGKKILLVNLSKGRLGDLNANLIGLILVGKILMAALSRADSSGIDLPPFYLYIDEFQNITTDSIASILSEARKYKLSLTVAHQFIAQIDQKIRDAIFGNVGSMAVFRVGSEDAEFLEKQLSPVFSAKDIQNIDNYNAYMKLLVKGIPQKPFDIRIPAPEKGNPETGAAVKAASHAAYGRPRAEVEGEILAKYKKPEENKPIETLTK